MTPEIEALARRRAQHTLGARADALPTSLLLPYLLPEEQPLEPPLLAAPFEKAAEPVKELFRATLRDEPLPEPPDMSQRVVALVMRGWETLEAVLLRGYDTVAALVSRFEDMPKLREALIRYAPQNDLLVRLALDLWTRFKAPGHAAMRTASWFWNILAGTLRAVALVEGLPVTGTVAQALQALRQVYRLAARVFAPAAVPALI